MQAILNLIFPPLCLHCKDWIPSQRNPLCQACLQQLTLIEIEGRCLACFGLIDEGQKRCADCSVKGFRVAAACEYLGPAITLVHAYKYGGDLHLAKAMAGLMALQFTHLDWPMPDLIVPVPQTTAHYFARGYDQTALLAKELSLLLGRPTHALLKRSSGDFSQSGLNQEQRRQLVNSSFGWKTQADITGKIILLIDDVATTRSTLSHCAHLLQEGFPKRVYALTFSAA
jgi:competence protein ComFC